LFLDGLLVADLTAAVPAVAGWRGAGLPEHLRRDTKQRSSIQASPVRNGRRDLQSGRQCHRAPGQPGRNLRPYSWARLRPNRPVPTFQQTGLPQDGAIEAWMP